MKKLPVVVVSLFDGLSGGRIVFDRVEHIQVLRYYSSEVKPHAIQAANTNYPQDMPHRLGDITKIDWQKLLAEIREQFGEVKIILIGGSPCQGFSFAGKQLNFNDHRSILFFKFAEAKKILKPEFFMLENVNMKQIFQDVISEHLEAKPIRINSTLLSATTRDRLYWTNILNIDIPVDKCVTFNDIKDSNVDEDLFIPSRYKIDFNEKHPTNTNKSIRLGGYMKQGQGQRVYSMKGKSVCLSALGGGWGAKTGLYLDGDRARKPTIRELCKLQTIPAEYFNGCDLSYSKIAELVGDGWTIDVPAHIFRHIPLELDTNQE